MASNNVAVLCLKVPDTLDPYTVAFLTDLCGRYGLAELVDSDESVSNVIAQEAPNAEDKKAVDQIAEGSGGVAQEPVLNAEVGNAEVRNAPNDDKKTVVLITKDSGGVVLKILSRLAALVGCAAVVYAAYKITDGVDTWKVYAAYKIIDGVDTWKEAGWKIVDGVDTWKEAGCKVQMNLENLTIFEKFSIWST